MESLQLYATIYQVYIHPLQLQGLVICAASWVYPGDAVSLASSVTKLIYRVFPINTKTMEAVASSEEDLELRFQRAAARMRSNTSLRLSNDQKLLLYGYFKQVWLDYMDLAVCASFYTFTSVLPLCRPMKVLATHQSLDSLTSQVVQNGQLHIKHD